MNRLGATPEEAAAAYPGDELIADPYSRSTMATTIDAPPSEVWPWLAQMGCDRGGFYSWDRLDNGGRPSAKQIHSEWQDLHEGDRVFSMPDGSMWFDVAVLEPERTLMLRASMSLPRPRWFDPTDAEPAAFSDSTWGFHLRPTPDGKTRLIVRGTGRGRPRWLVWAANVLVGEPAHWVMQTRQFAGLRSRVAQASPERMIRGRNAIAGLSAAVALSRPLLRERVLTWGATEAEAAARLPGDDLLEDATMVSTRAITIDARASAVWPWIVQMGVGRGGAYTYDWIERLLGLDMHSSDRVIPELQDVDVGDVLPMAPNAPGLRVEIADVERAFALRSEDGRWVWTFVLRESGGSTRLISRNRSPAARSLREGIAMLVMEPGSLVMERKMLQGIKERAERLRDD
jgi:proline iminopeptidase